MNQHQVSNKSTDGAVLFRVDGQAVTVFSKAPGSAFSQNEQPLRCSPETLSALMKELESEMFGTIPVKTNHH